MQPELNAVARLLELHLEEQLESGHRGAQRWIEDIYGSILPIRRYFGYWDQTATDQFLDSLHQRRFELKPSSFQAGDELVFRVYCTDHTYATLKTRLNERAAEIKQLAAKKLKLQDKELILVHVKSNGERMIYNDQESNISTALSVNGRIFVCPLDHIDAISPLPEQDPFQEAYQSSSSSLTSSSQVPDATTSSALANEASAQNQAGQADHMTSGLANCQASGQASSNYLTSNIGDQFSIASHLLEQTPTNLNVTKTQMTLSVTKLEEFSSRDIAFCLTQLAWSLLKNMHEYELIYAVFGRQDKSSAESNENEPNSTSTLAYSTTAARQTTNIAQTNGGATNVASNRPTSANLNIFLRHFNELQYWVVTQICLSSSLSKRAQILRKFIKIAAQ